MKPLAISSHTLVSALGGGIAETTRALFEGRSGLRRWDLPWADFDTYVGRVDGIEESPVIHSLAAFDCRNNRLAQMGLQSDGFEDAVRAVAERYGRDRVAVILGTSTSGIRETEKAFADRDPRDGSLPDWFNFDTTHDYHSLTEFVRRYLDLHGPALTISTACSSSAKTFADAALMIEIGICDAAVVGGVDSLCLLTMKGFGSLELTSPEPCRPNDVARSGISIGEAAGFAIVEQSDAAPRAPVALYGYGESCDAYHMSSPDPEGVGAAEAMRRALDRSGVSPRDIGYVNLHGTGSVFNDKAEDAAVFSVLGGSVPCSSTKGWTGHALGGAGIAEAIISCISLVENFIPNNLNMREADPALTCNIVADSFHVHLDRVLTNSFGFGGNNCSLILGRTQ